MKLKEPREINSDNRAKWCVSLHVAIERTRDIGKWIHYELRGENRLSYLKEVIKEEREGGNSPLATNSVFNS
jgi:hypothetical protein